VTRANEDTWFVPNQLGRIALVARANGNVLFIDGAHALRNFALGLCNLARRNDNGLSIPDFAGAAPCPGGDCVVSVFAKAGFVVVGAT